MSKIIEEELKLARNHVLLGDYTKGMMNITHIYTHIYIYNQNTRHRSDRNVRKRVSKPSFFMDKGKTDRYGRAQIIKTD